MVKVRAGKYIQQLTSNGVCVSRGTLRKSVVGWCGPVISVD
jgi:hypothetical protein